MDFEKIEKAIEKVPKEVSDLLFSEEIGSFLWNLAEKNKLDEETTLKMIDEVGYLILGLKERSSFKSSLYNLKIQQSAVLSLIQEVNRKIFTELDKIKPAITTESKEPEEKPQPTEPQPVVITQETKEGVLKELNNPVKSPESDHGAGLPAVEKGEVAHEVKPTTDNQQLTTVEIKAEKPKQIVQTPNYGYEKGGDPYREPLG